MQRHAGLIFFAECGPEISSARRYLGERFTVVDQGAGFVIGISNSDVWPGRDDAVSAGSGRRCLTVVGGGVHNTGELKDLLSVPRSASASRAELVSTLYDRFGAEAFRKLIGEFAICIYDHRTQTVFLGRDPVGARPLFYTIKDRYIAWSTDVAFLTSLNGAGDLADDDYFASFLANTECLRHTPYRSIRRVPPGHYLSAGRTGSRLCRYWDAAAIPPVRLSADRDYEDRFLDLFRTSISDRLPEKGTVTAELSGGLDSSAIVCMADDLSAAGHKPRTLVETVSLTYDRSITSDESEFIGAVEAQRGRRGHHIAESENPLFPVLDADRALMPNHAISCRRSDAAVRVTLIKLTTAWSACFRPAGSIWCSGL